MKPTNLMSRSRFARTAMTVVAIASIGFMTACSGDSITSPTGIERTSGIDRNNGLITDVLSTVNKLLDSVLGLLRTTPVPTAITKSLKVTRAAGGTIKIPETGFTLTIPAGAIRTDTLTITVTALPGRAIAYEFGPHGTTFLKPLTFTQELGNTLFSLLGKKPVLTGGYFKDKSQVNTNTGVAKINEDFDTIISGNKVSFGISHFSGYMIATGRSSHSDSNDASPE